jgi:hypothetical protein
LKDLNTRPELSPNPTPKSSGMVFGSNDAHSERGIRKLKKKRQKTLYTKSLFINVIWLTLLINMAEL